MKSYRKILLAACAVVMFSFAAIAADAETQLVTATGYGMSVDEAKKAAVRAAVESVVGTIVDAETLVENDELVQDKILSYSAGLVEDVKIIGEPVQTSAGLVTVRAQVKVRKTELAERVKTTIRTSTKVDGESLYQKTIFARENRNDAQAIFEKLFIPERLQTMIKAEATPGDTGSPITIDNITEQVSVHVNICVDLESYRQWTDEINEKIGLMGGKKSEGVAEAVDYYGVWAVDCYKYEGYKFSICVNYRSKKVISWFLPKDIAAIVDKVLKNRSYATPIKTGMLKVSLLDRFGEEIKIVEQSIGGVFVVQGGSSGMYNTAEIYPSIGIHVDSYGRRDDGKTSGSLTVPIGVLSEKDLRDLDSISVAVYVKDEEPD